MLIPEQYRRLENDRGRSLSEIGAKGIAFTRSDILTALQCLKGSQIVVLGGDVLTDDKGKLRYTHDSWYVNRRDGEAIVDYVERSIERAENYVRNFPDPDDSTVFYSPVLSELGLIAPR